MNKISTSTRQLIIIDMKKLDNKTVIGDGFRIVVPDIHRVLYVDDKHEATIEIEGGINDNKVDWFVYTSTLSSRINDDQAFIFEKRELILQRISCALDILDMPHRMI